MKKAQGLFQWAFVACDYIARPPRDLNSKLCFRRVLNPPTTFKRAPNPLDTHYTTVLEGFYIEVCDGFHSAMRGSFQPLSVDVLSIMRRLDSSSECIVDNLESPLSHVTPLESDFYVNLNDIHVGFMLATLRTVICKLEMSYPLNSEVPDLKKRMKDNIALSSLERWLNQTHDKVSVCSFPICMFSDGNLGCD